jgi:uncharacterized membrane protein (TIGR02234 family)
MTKGRELMTAVLLLVIGGAVGAFTVGRHWATASVSLGAGSLRSVPLTGREMHATELLGLALLASAAAVLATRGWTRLAVGVLGVLLAVGLFAHTAEIMWTRGTAAGDSAAVQLLVPTSSDQSVPATLTAWPWIAIISGFVAFVGAAMVLVRGRGWPALGQRYEAPGTPKVAEPVGAQGVWDALDRGEDPT